MKKIVFILLIAFQAAGYAQNVNELKAICEKENTSESWIQLATYYYENNVDIQLAKQAGEKAYERALIEKDDKQTGVALMLLAEINYPDQWSEYIDMCHKAIAHFRKANAIQQECETYSQMGHTYNVIGEYDLAIEHFKKSEQLFKLTEFRNEVASIVYINMGFAYLYKGQTDSALHYISEANEIASLVKDTVVLIACNDQLGIIHRRNGDYASAIEHFNQSLSLYETTKNNKAVCITLMNIANIYTDWIKFDKALHFGREAVKQAVKYPQETHNLGRIFNSMGALLINVKEYKSAVDTLLIANTILTESKFESYINNLNLSVGYYNLHQMDSTDIYMRMAEKLLEENPNFPALRYYQVKGSQLAKSGRYNEAIPFLEKYVEESQNTQRKFVFGEYEIYNLLATSLEKGLKDYKKALYYKNMTYDYRDSLYRKEQSNTVEDFYVKYQTAEKDLQISNLNYQQQRILYNRTLMIGVFMIIVILLFAAWIYSRFLTIKKSKEAIELKRKFEEKESEYQVLINDMELWQMKLYLTGLEAERERLAKELHDNVLNNIVVLDMKLKADKEQPGIIHTQIEELYTQVRSISHDLMPPAFKYASLYDAIDNYLLMLNEQSGILFELVIDGREVDIPQKIAFEIYRIIQETTSNVLKHSQASKAIITFKTLDSYIKLSVLDNGNGFDTQKRGKGIGLQIIKDRCQSIQGKLNIHTEVGKGCEIEITIPFSPLDEDE